MAVAVGRVCRSLPTPARARCSHNTGIWCSYIFNLILFITCFSRERWLGVLHTSLYTVAVLELNREEIGLHRQRTHVTTTQTAISLSLSLLLTTENNYATTENITGIRATKLAVSLADGFSSRRIFIRPVKSGSARGDSSPLGPQSNVPTAQGSKWRNRPRRDTIKNQFTFWDAKTVHDLPRAGMMDGAY